MIGVDPREDRRRAGWPATGAGTVAPPAAAMATAHPMTVAGDLDAVDRLPRRVPVPALRPALDLCVPTGITLGAGARVVVMPDEGGVGGALSTALAKAGVTVLTLDPARPDRRPARDPRRRGAPRARSTVSTGWPRSTTRALYEALDLAGWREGLRRRVKTLYATMRRLYDDAPFLVTGTRLGGYHGYDDAGATAPDGRCGDRVRQGVQARAARRAGQGRRPAVEPRGRGRWPSCSSTRRCATPAASRSATRTAGAGASVSPSAPFPPHGDRRTSALTLGRGQRRASSPGRPAASSPAITADLARASGGDLPPARPHPGAGPGRSRPAPLRRGPGRVQVDLAARMKERGERPTPVAIEKELARLRAAGRRAGRDRRGRGSRRDGRTTTPSTSPTPTPWPG